MKAWIPALFIILFIQAEPAVGFQADGGIKPDESDSTESGFILRSQDLFWQTGYHPVSLDRMSFMLDSHIYGRYGPSPDFYADGIPFDPSFFGMTFTQLIPVPVHQLKQNRRIAKRGSGIQEGKPYGAGIVELFSEPVKKGFSISAAGQIGHNSGEPGPWVFDPERVSPNVERFGPWVDAATSLRLGSWYVRGVLRTNSYIHVDEFLQNRLINLRALPETGEFLRPEASATLGLVETGFQTSRLSIRVQGLTSESEDFLFFQPLGREVPTTTESNQFSGLMHAKLNDRIGLRSLVQVREKELGYRRHRFSHNFDWRRESLLARSSVYYDSDKTTAEFGAELEDISLEAAGLSGYREQYRKGFVQLKQSVTGSLRFDGEGRVTASKDDAAYSGMAGLHLDVTENWQIALRGHYDELLSEQARPLDEWVLNGYSIFNQLGIQGLYVSNGEKSRSREVSMAQQLNIAGKITIASEIGWIENISMPLPFQYAAYNFPFSTEPGTYLLQQNEGGRRITGNIQVQFERSPRVRHSAVLFMNRVENGNRLYNLYWKSTPELSVQYSVNYEPYRDLAIQVKTQYISEREWPEFERIDGRSNRTFYVQYPYRFFTFENDLPAHINIDMTISKWFWDQRFRGVLLLKNMLNSHYQTHPLGIREGFGYLLRLEMRI
jgi:hypothetical protein